MIRVGLAVFATEAVRVAALPLFEAGVVDAIEWTVDLGWSEPVPDWTTALLEAYGDAGRLYGHGVTLSPTTARRDDAGARWLDRLARDPYRYRHLTEHWGFSRARGIIRSAPMPVLACTGAVTSTIEALRGLAAVARVPVGLENLALAFGPADVDAQPAMLATVLDAIDGVLLLDLHNLWCQAVNYQRDVRELATRYPLHRVRELHVAGGSWSASEYGAPFRRDTHDALVPREVMDLVAWIIPRCPALEVVILERLPDALGDHEAWRGEWRELAAAVRGAPREPIEVPRPVAVDLDALTPASTSAYQDALTAVLLAGGDARTTRSALLAHPDAAPVRAQIAGWDLRAIEVALALTRRWAVRA